MENIKIKNKMNIKTYKINENAEIPFLSTDLAAGFDLTVCFHEENVKINGGKFKIKPEIDSNGKKFIRLFPGDRVLIPTGLIFLLPPEYQMKINPRSGMAWKHGITVLNSPGTIDPDYTLETKAILVNSSLEPYVIEDGDKVAQAEIVPRTSWDVKFSSVEFEEVENFRKNMNREGGFGHTGR